MKTGISLGIVLFVLIWPGSSEAGEVRDEGIKIKIGPDYKIFVQKIRSPDSQWWFALFADTAGFGDPSWYLYRFPATAHVENLKIERGSDSGAIFWNYSEGGDQINNPKIELVGNRYIVFTRGGLYHSLCDIQENRVLVNNVSPYHAVVYSEEYKKLNPTPSVGETGRMIKEWKTRNLHEPIEKVIGKKKFVP